jgi:sugar lactone lactonase YvrE
MADTTTLVDGRAFLEGPRWHGGQLYVSDMHGHEVLRVSLDGEVEVVARVDAAPSGLGWLPDGSMLIVSMDDRKLLRLDGTELHEVADCSPFATNEINDMVVDRHGHAFISQFGSNFHAGEPLRPAPVLRVDPDGSVQEATDPLRFANGMVITADQRTIVIAESAGACLTVYDLADDGALTNKRIWAELGSNVPDGIAIDADDAVWVACPIKNQCVRVVEGGEVTATVETEGEHAIACAVGGDDGGTLFVCTSPTVGEPDKSRDLRGARVEVVRI